MHQAILTVLDLGITSLALAREFVEKESKNTEKYGVDPEGFVVYHQDLPLCKLKNQNYVQKHGICAGDLLMQRNVIIERFFQETLDDIWESLRDSMKEFAEELRGKVRGLISEVVELHSHIVQAKDTLKDRKSYALLLQAKSTNTKLFPFFHVHYEQILSDSSLDIADLYMKWLKKGNYNKYIAYFKDTRVAKVRERAELMAELYMKANEEKQRQKEKEKEKEKEAQNKAESASDAAQDRATLLM